MKRQMMRRDAAMRWMRSVQHGKCGLKCGLTFECTRNQGLGRTNLRLFNCALHQWLSVLRSRVSPQPAAPASGRPASLVGRVHRKFPR
jgi:hypothetical protein